MRVKDVMSSSPHCCSPDDGLQAVAKLMDECDCGAIPVVDKKDNEKPVGIVTDRDIVVRVVARGGDAAKTKVRDCMSKTLATVSEDDSIEDCCNEMEHAKVRRILVVDGRGKLRGIVSQADIALRTREQNTGELVRKVSEPTSEPSLVG